MFGREVGIAEVHGRRRVPQEVAHSGQGDSPHNEPESERVAEVVKVEDRKLGSFTCYTKGMPHVVIPSSLDIMEHQGNLWLSS